MTDTAAILARHVQGYEGDCARCADPWPCDAHLLGVALEEMDKDRFDVWSKWRDAEAREAKLRLALAYLWNLPWDEVDDEAQRIVDAERRTVSHDMGLCHCPALATEAE